MRDLRDMVARELMLIDGLLPPYGDLRNIGLAGNHHCRKYLERADRVLAVIDKHNLIPVRSIKQSDGADSLD